jgi:CopG antitoxin of type II toxin-antitoxin system
MKTKVKARKHSDPLPEHFDNIEEAAEFWDTHDSAEYEEFMREVDSEVEIKRRTYWVSLNGELYRKVRAIAQEKGVPADALVNLWVEEKAS